MNTPIEVYQGAAEALTDRILKLIPERPEILTITDPWDLFGVPGFTCSDLDVTAAMAHYALIYAKRQYAEKCRATEVPA